MAVIIAVLTAVLFVRPTPILRALVEHRLLASVLLPVVLIGGFVGVLALGPATLIELSPGIVGLVGLTALAVSVWSSLREPDDAVVPPMSTSGETRSGRVFTAAVMPAIPLLVCALSYVLHLMA